MVQRVSFVHLYMFRSNLIRLNLNHLNISDASCLIIYERSEAFDKLPLDAKYAIVQVYNSPYLSIEQIRVDLSKRIDKAMAYSSSLRPGDTDCCYASNHVGLLLSVSYFFNS